MKKIFQLMVVCLLGVYSVASLAGQWSAGARVGQSSIDDIEQVCFLACLSVEDSDTALGLSLGYQINETWGIEAGYVDFGKFSVKDDIFTFSGGFGVAVIDVDVDASALYLAGSATVPFSDAWSGTLLVGIASADAKANGRAGLVRGSTSISDEEAYLAGQIDYHFNDRFKMGLRYETVSDVNAITLGAGFSF